MLDIDEWLQWAATLPPMGGQNNRAAWREIDKLQQEAEQNEIRD